MMTRCNPGRSTPKTTHKSSKKGLRWGIILFVISEILCTVSFFWAFFHTRLSPTIELESTSPPTGIQPFNPIQGPYTRQRDPLNHRYLLLHIIITQKFGIFMTPSKKTSNFETMQWLLTIWMFSQKIKNASEGAESCGCNVGAPCPCQAALLNV
jgi:heme/copper-type cytochrome/quinol oxidase subunit 3